MESLVYGRMILAAGGGHKTCLLQSLKPMLHFIGTVSCMTDIISVANFTVLN